MQTHKLTLIALAMLGSSVISASLMADEQQRRDAEPQSAMQGSMMQGQGMMDMDRMQERFKSMQQLMDRIHKTDDHGARQKLMREHMQEMQKTMMGMRGMMMGPGMMPGGSGGKMGSGMMGGGAMMGGKGMSTDDRQKTMEQRLDVMPQTMEQMVEQMMLQEGAAKKAK